jgi:hypothetical protein
MNLWEKTPSGKKRFRHGKENHRLAGQAARQCPSFIPDDDDERVSDEALSCYNCRYRRWTPDSFECMKP